MPGHIHGYISTIMSQKPKWIYLYMHLHTYVYSECNREVGGSSPTRGELFSKKFLFWGFIYDTHTYTLIYIYIYIYTFLGSVLYVLPC